jgi:hypothetical protein
VDAKRPAKAAAIIPGEFAFYQGGVSPDGCEVRLGPLDSLLGPRRGIDCEKPAAARLKEAYQR